MMYRIVCRAFGKFTEIETAETWLNAELRAMELQAANNDGEYMTRMAGEADIRPSVQCPVQAAWAYL